MVAAAMAAAKAAHAAGSAAATGIGIGMGTSDMALTRELFKLQMRQAKRLWAADWAESSVRHGEACMQSAQQHAEAQALGMASYYQAEKLAMEGIRLARDQDSRAYEMAWRAEVRESLRDELANQYNRFNIVMLCDTVCLSCVFSLVAEASLPTETPMWMINLYVFSMGVSIMLFTVSLLLSVIAVRRLHEHTAAILERKLFALSEDLQRRWRDQLSTNQPTGAHEANLLNQAYEKWVERYLKPIGEPAIHMMAIGVVTMFITAGLLTHNLYLIQYGSRTAGVIFWCMVLITSTAVVWIKYREDHWEKRKLGIYDNSWRDKSSIETGPFAKIHRAARELFNDKFNDNSSRAERMAKYHQMEREEKKFVPDTQSLHDGAKSLQEESAKRSKTRKDVLKLLTTAAEELDALPEELTVQLNKLLHEIGEADGRTANLIVSPETDDSLLDKSNLRKSTRWSGGIKGGWNRGKCTKFGRSPPVRSTRSLMTPPPIDAQCRPVNLPLLRTKLGESSISTLLRIRNVTDEPLRLKSGIRLKEGKYIRRLKAISTAENNNDDSGGGGGAGGEKCTFQLYPPSEIPPHSEAIIAAQNNGRWLATSGIDGEICYTNRSETWKFRIRFRNELLRKVRSCHVQAIHIEQEDDDDDSNDGEDEDRKVLGRMKDQHWTISKEELDIKANNELLIKINAKQGIEDEERQERNTINHQQSPHKTFPDIAGRGSRGSSRDIEDIPIECVLGEDSTSVISNYV